MCVKGVESVLGVWWDYAGLASGWVACADGGVCGERPVVSEGIEGEDGGRESGQW